MKAGQEHIRHFAHSLLDTLLDHVVECSNDVDCDQCSSKEKCDNVGNKLYELKGAIDEL